MAAKKKTAKKVKKQVIRIPKGSMGCSFDSVAYVVEKLMNMGFKLDDLDSTTITKDYSFCYYESDEPGICVEWDDIID